MTASKGKWETGLKRILEQYGGAKSLVDAVRKRRATPVTPVKEKPKARLPYVDKDDEPD